MAITQILVSSPSGETIFNDTAMGASADAVKTSGATVYYVIVDNSANGAATYVKLYNLASGSVVVGTTVPDQTVYAPANAVITEVYSTKAAPGKLFGTALSAVALTTGGTAGATPPVSSVPVTIVYA